MLAQASHIKGLDRVFSLFKFLVVPYAAGAYHLLGGS